MTQTLTTAVSGVITRVLLMQAAAIPTSTNAVKDWIQWEQTPPYFTNLPARLSPTDPGGGYWELEITMRLIIAHITQVKAGTTTPQSQSWTYIPEVVGYFQTYKQLDMPGQVDVQYLDPKGLTISCNTGAALVSLPGQTNTSLKADFELTIPLLIMSQHGA